MAPSPQPSIAIVGGGLAGLTLSIGLTRHGIPHRIYESAPAFAEVGAGIALGPNSITALELIDPRIKDELRKCITYNEGVDADGEGAGKEDFMDIRLGEEGEFNTFVTTVRHTGLPEKPGRACFHRAKLLEGLIKLIPPSTASFGKLLTSIQEDSSTCELILNFADGTTSTASAVIACDGIKSVVRQNHFSSSFPDQIFCRPAFVNEFAYRGFFSRDQFLEITEDAINPGRGTLFCGRDTYVVMYPVEKGDNINMVAVKHIPPPSPDSELAILQHNTNWLQPVTSETVLSDFEAWGTPVKALLSASRPERWAIYDHLPAPTYVKGRVALMGDSAHATTPHQGQGAGMAFEDSFILSSILGEILNEPLLTPIKSGEESTEIAKMNAKIESCFRAYDEVRRPRTQKLTRTSREMGEILGFAGNDIGKDLDKLKENLDARMSWIWNVDLPREVKRGVEIAREGLQTIIT